MNDGNTLLVSVNKSEQKVRLPNEFSFRHRAYRDFFYSRVSGSFSRYAVASPVKRSLDVLGASVLLLLMSPLLAFAAAAVWAIDGGPVIYRHNRVGRDGKRFDCLKLRSMRRDAEAALAQILTRDPSARAEWDAYRKLRHDPRVLPLIGGFLRRTSLDELPQLFNVLSGRMSLVGPRPVTEEELEKYGDALGHYLAVRPGLSGRWQISGRSDVSFGARTQIDRIYVETATLSHDLRILLLTPLAVILGRGSA